MKIPHRILTDAPRLPHVQREIAKAILTLTAQDEEERALARGRGHKAALRNESAAPGNELDLIKHYYRQSFLSELAAELRAELRRANFRSDQPRWPIGSGEISGRWSGGAGVEPPAPPKPIPPDLPPKRFGIGHNQGPPLEEPPEIPSEAPPTRNGINDVLKALARWLARAGVRTIIGVAAEATIGGPIGMCCWRFKWQRGSMDTCPMFTRILNLPRHWTS